MLAKSHSIVASIMVLFASILLGLKGPAVVKASDQWAYSCNSSTVFTADEATKAMFVSTWSNQAKTMWLSEAAKQCDSSNQNSSCRGLLDIPKLGIHDCKLLRLRDYTHEDTKVLVPGISGVISFPQQVGGGYDNIPVQMRERFLILNHHYNDGSGEFSTLNRLNPGDVIQVYGTSYTIVSNYVGDWDVRNMSDVADNKMKADFIYDKVFLVTCEGDVQKRLITAIHSR